MASLYDSASLVMIPSGVKEDKLYSIKPTDGSGDFTFSRDADIEATRVNSSGLIEKAKVNLLLQSNTFSNSSWNRIDGTLTSGQTGYDGSSDAWQYTTTSTAGSIYQLNTQSGVQTFSVYVKGDGSTGVRMYAFGSVNQTAFFNLNTGEVTSDASIKAQIQDVGGGWYRCAIAVNQTNSQVRLYTTNAAATTNSAGTIFIQDAQLNHGLVAQDYVETTTTAVVEGLTADLPRLDYSGGASCPSLLLEPSRTNLVPNSEYVDANFSGSFETNAAISPDGTMNASKFVFTQGASFPQFYLSLSGLTIGQQYTSSIYLKKTEASEDFEMVSSGVAFTPTDEWQRVVRQFTATGTTQTILVNYVTSVPVGVVNEVYVWGAQAELGTYETSYIPTYGTAANRGADSCSKTGISSLIGQTEGTLFAEVDAVSLSENRRIMFTYEDGNNFIMLTMTSSNTLRFLVFAGGAIQADLSTPISVENVKIAGAYKANDFVLYVNGTQVGSDTNGSVPTTSDLYLGVDLASALSLADGLKQALLFKTRLTNAELAALTTI